MMLAPAAALSISSGSCPRRTAQRRGPHRAAIAGVRGGVPLLAPGVPTAGGRRRAAPARADVAPSPNRRPRSGAQRTSGSQPPASRMLQSSSRRAGYRRLYCPTVAGSGSASRRRPAAACRDVPPPRRAGPPRRRSQRVAERLAEEAAGEGVGGLHLGQPGLRRRRGDRARCGGGFRESGVSAGRTALLDELAA